MWERLFDLVSDDPDLEWLMIDASHIKVHPHAHYLMADKAYDTNDLLGFCNDNSIQAVIPPKRNRTEQRDYDKNLYKIRHLVANAFLKLKQWRGIATRYAKTTASFLAECQIAAIILWIR